LEIALDVARAGSVPEQPLRLSRRNRQIIVDADFYGDDHAVVWFVRRGHGGEQVDEFWRLARASGEWSSPGGGGGEPGADLESRPSLGEIAASNERFPFGGTCEFAITSGGGGGMRGEDGVG